MFDPDPAEYARSGSSFGIPFFAVLAAFCKAQDNAGAFIHRGLGLPLADARALEQELRQ